MRMPAEDLDSCRGDLLGASGAASGGGESRNSGTRYRGRGREVIALAVPFSAVLAPDLEEVLSISVSRVVESHTEQEGSGFKFSAGQHKAEIVRYVYQRGADGFCRLTDQFQTLRRFHSDTASGALRAAADWLEKREGGKA